MINKIDSLVQVLLQNMLRQDSNQEPVINIGIQKPANNIGIQEPAKNIGIQ